MEMHGAAGMLSERYDDNNTTAPRCEICHAGEKSANIYHRTHWETPENDEGRSLLQCQVCHAQDYKNCNACHTGGAGITGSSYMQFKIGKNSKQSADKPYDYVVVRHIPIARDTFTSWGVGDLPDYDQLPTWKYATPHNIRRWTARTDTTGGITRCSEKCHDRDNNIGTYLRLSDLDADEVNANQNVIIP